jgi:hypothetical protein
MCLQMRSGEAILHAVSELPSEHRCNPRALHHIDESESVKDLVRAYPYSAHLFRTFTSPLERRALHGSRSTVRA